MFDLISKKKQEYSDHNKIKKCDCRDCSSFRNEKRKKMLDDNISFIERERTFYLFKEMRGKKNGN